jgi:hypothetical protein
VAGAVGADAAVEVKHGPDHALAANALSRMASVHGELGDRAKGMEAERALSRAEQRREEKRREEERREE